MKFSFLISRAIIIPILFFSWQCKSQKYSATDLVGKWLVAEKSAVITFFSDKDTYFGMTSWMQQPKDAEGKLVCDTKNPDPARRTQPLLGALLCKNFVYDGDGVWVDGTIYDSRTGKTYSCKITMKDKNTISVRGYVGVSLVGGST